MPEHVECIHGSYRGFQDVESIARVVTLLEIASNDRNISVSCYAEPKVDPEALPIEEAMKQLKNSADAAFAAERLLNSLLREHGMLLADEAD